MTLIENDTAEAQFTCCRDTGLYPVQQIDEAATAVSSEEERPADSKVLNFTADFLLEHSLISGNMPAVAIGICQDDAQIRVARNGRWS